MPNTAAEIVRFKQELARDPRSLRFVTLADLLRTQGEWAEAADVLSRGLAVHPELRSALLVKAKLLRDQGKLGRALAILDDLHPRDSGNVVLVEMYCDLLLGAGRLDDAELVLQKAQFAGLADAVLARLEEALEHSRGGIDEDIEDLASLGGVMTLPGLYLEDLGDPFAVPVVAARVARSGRRSAARAIWREVARIHPDQSSRANREIARLDGIAGRVGTSTNAPTVVLPPANPVAAAAVVRAWGRKLGRVD